MKAMLNVDNSKSVEKMGSTIIDVIEAWGSESDQVKLDILETLRRTGNAPLTVSGCTFDNKDVK